MRKPSPGVRRFLFWSASFLVVAFVGAQFIRPPLTHPAVTAELQAPPEVKRILVTSCYNCHSNETKLAWFDQLAPAYWVVVHDVNKARKHVNFSEIGKLPAAQQRGLLFEAVNQIQLGAMPLPSYRLAHPAATVTTEQLAVLRNYLHPPSNSSTAVINSASADAQYNKWIQLNTSSRVVEPAPNGMAFIPGYKDWKAISSTERFDNGSLRVILANDVAVRAIAAKRINPWPDGSAFAKVAWAQQPDEQGILHSGAFQQVEFMVRNSKKYADTKGWGWARWRGDNLKPYGKDALFTNECVSCHMPVQKNDYVYTMPFAGQE